MTPHNDKEMTAVDRARSITCYFEMKYPVGPNNWYSECEPYLAEQIKLAEQAAYERGLKETLGIQSSVADLEQEAYVRGRDIGLLDASERSYERGLEEAAKVCDEHDKKDHWPTTYLGQRIRALKEVRR